MTLVPETHAPDEVFGRVKALFSEKETVDLSWAIAAINAWNRMAIRADPGQYQPPARH